MSREGLNFERFSCGGHLIAAADNSDGSEPSSPRPRNIYSPEGEKLEASRTLRFYADYIDASNYARVSVHSDGRVNVETAGTFGLFAREFTSERFAAFVIAAVKKEASQ